jgi:hypothetical protein
MMQKSTVLLIIGVMLIIAAFLKAYSIPLEANKDFNRREPLDWNSKESEYIYVQGSEHRRLLQNFYIGASGIVCLLTSLMTFPVKNSNNAPSHPVPLKNDRKLGENIE